jgi:hypothetical protein
VLGFNIADEAIPPPLALDSEMPEVSFFGQEARRQQGARK